MGFSANEAPYTKEDLEVYGTWHIQESEVNLECYNVQQDTTK